MACNGIVAQVDSNPTLLPSCRAMPHMLLLHCAAMPCCSMQAVPQFGVLLTMLWHRLIDCCLPPSNTADKVFLLQSRYHTYLVFLLFMLGMDIDGVGPRAYIKSNALESTIIMRMMMYSEYL